MVVEVVLVVEVVEVVVVFDVDVDVYFDIYDIDGGDEVARYPTWLVTADTKSGIEARWLPT